VAEPGAASGAAQQRLVASRSSLLKQHGAPSQKELPDTERTLAVLGGDVLTVPNPIHGPMSNGYRVVGAHVLHPVKPQAGVLDYPKHG